MQYYLLYIGVRSLHCYTGDLELPCKFFDMSYTPPSPICRNNFVIYCFQTERQFARIILSFSSVRIWLAHVLSTSFIRVVVNINKVWNTGQNWMHRHLWSSVCGNYHAVATSLAASHSISIASLLSRLFWKALVSNFVSRFLRMSGGWCCVAPRLCTSRCLSNQCDSTLPCLRLSGDAGRWVRSGWCLFSILRLPNWLDERVYHSQRKQKD